MYCGIEVNLPPWGAKWDAQPLHKHGCGVVSGVPLMMKNNCIVEVSHLFASEGVLEGERRKLDQCQP